MIEPFLLLLIPLILLAAGWHYLRHRKQKQIKQEKAATIRQAEQSLVSCFTCGMKIPREGALEKKGRYFCGVKKQERDAAISQQP